MNCSDQVGSMVCRPPLPAGPQGNSSGGGSPLTRQSLVGQLCPLDGRHDFGKTVPMLVPATSEKLQGRGLKSLHVLFQFLGNKSTARNTSVAVITAKPCDIHGVCKMRLRPTADTAASPFIVGEICFPHATTTEGCVHETPAQAQPRLSESVGLGFAQSSSCDLTRPRI